MLLQSRLLLEIHASQDIAIAIPRSEYWLPTKIMHNGKVNNQVYRTHGWVYVWVREGINHLSISGKVAPMQSWQLAFKNPPKSIVVSPSEFWLANGITDNQLRGNEIEFTSTQTASLFSGKAVNKDLSLATTSNSGLVDSQQHLQYSSQPLVSVTRSIVFEQTWRINTSVKRIAPATGSINVSIPLLKGEFILSNNVQAEHDQVSVSLGSTEQQIAYLSGLERTDVVSLHASSKHLSNAQSKIVNEEQSEKHAGNQQIIEQWQIMASPNTHIEFDGVPEVLSILNDKDYYTHNFYPYPDETLTMSIARPQAKAGVSLAFDMVKLSVNQGKRNANLELELAYRTNKGGDHSITLPADYQLDSIRANGSLLNIQAQGNQLTFPLSPGDNALMISMSNEVGYQIIAKQPEFDLKAPVSNLYSNMTLGGQRWVLWTSGPVIGPAVLYWGELLVFIVLALIVSRLPFSPLGTVSWILLGLGLSMSNWSILVLLVLWFAAIYGGTKRSKEMNKTGYNLSQFLLYGFSAITILALIFTIPFSLLSSPDMGIAGNAQLGSGLSWFADESAGMLPAISVLSLPIFAYKAIMLVWVIWLCFAFVNWSKWVWQQLGLHGYWRTKEKTSE